MSCGAHGETCVPLTAKLGLLEVPGLPLAMGFWGHMGEAGGSTGGKGRRREYRE